MSNGRIGDKRSHSGMQEGHESSIPKVILFFGTNSISTEGSIEVSSQS